MASAGIDYVELGKMAGKLAAQILKGEAKASDIPYETVTEYSTYYKFRRSKRYGNYRSVGFSRKGNRM